MKRGITYLMLFIFGLSLASAVAPTNSDASCDLSVTMLNQDPYPANPGEYVKLVFQIDGVQENDCGDITINLLPDYPLIFDPTEPTMKTFKRVDYLKDFDSSILVPYKVRVDKAALDGTNEIELTAKSENGPLLSEKFDLEVENTYADFETHIKDFDYNTNELTIEILNIEDSDVEALVIEIPKQNTINVKGPNKVIVGDLDSNDYTTADFEAMPNDGEFNIIVTYSDAQSLRRSVEKTLSFDSSYFQNRKADEPSDSKTMYYVWAVIILLVIWFIWRKISKARRKKKKLRK